jgi:putative ABC transport system substrate-binding protein
MRVSRRRLVQTAGAAGLGLLAGCRLPFSQQAQPTKVFRVGILGGTSSGIFPKRYEAFRQGLHDYGWVEGQNVFLEFRTGDGDAGDGDPEQLPALAADLVNHGADVIITQGSIAALAAKRATSSIPIVLVAVGDPVGIGLVASLARPGGHVTGLARIGPELASKQLELLQQSTAGVTRVGVLYDPHNPGRTAAFNEMERVGGALRMQIRGLELHDLAGAAALFDTAVAEGVEALVVQQGGPQDAAPGRIIELAAQARLPTTYGGRAWVEDGGLMFYGPSDAATYQRAAYYVDRILKGANPADLPVERPREFEFVINARTVQTLGLTIPQHVLLQATEIIQ